MNPGNSKLDALNVPSLVRTDYPVFIEAVTSIDSAAPAMIQ